MAMERLALVKKPLNCVLAATEYMKKGQQLSAKNKYHVFKNCLQTTLYCLFQITLSFVSYAICIKDIISKDSE